MEGIFHDLPCMLMSVVLLLSVYKAPRLVKLLWKLIRKTKVNIRGTKTKEEEVIQKFDFHRELIKQIKCVIQDV